MAQSKHDEPATKQHGSSKEEIPPPHPTIHGKLVSETQNAFIVEKDGVETTIFKTEGMQVTDDELVVSVPVAKDAPHTSKE